MIEDNITDFQILVVWQPPKVLNACIHFSILCSYKRLLEIARKSKRTYLKAIGCRSDYEVARVGKPTTSNYIVTGGCHSTTTITIVVSLVEYPYMVLESADCY